MDLDVRLPIGAMFIVLGPILLATGFVEQTYANVYTGMAMTAFSIVMLATGIRAHRRNHSKN